MSAYDPTEVFNIYNKTFISMETINQTLSLTGITVCANDKQVVAVTSYINNDLMSPLGKTDDQQCTQLRMKNVEAFDLTYNSRIVTSISIGGQTFGKSSSGDSSFKTQ